MYIEQAGPYFLVVEDGETIVEFETEREALEFLEAENA